MLIFGWGLRITTLPTVVYLLVVYIPMYCISKPYITFRNDLEKMFNIIIQSINKNIKGLIVNYMNML